MKTLVVYYSHTLNNAKLARKLQEKLDCDLLKIEELKKRTGFTILLDIVFNRRPAIRATHYSLHDYDKVIFMAPIWGGKIAAPLKTFLHQEKDNIGHYSFLTVCGGVKGQKAKIIIQLRELTNKEPDNVTELWINDLLSKEKKDTIKYTSGHRVDKDDLTFFEPAINKFLHAIGISFAESPERA